jgi:RNA polymerase sigma factor (sigma-70 family)
MAEAEQFVDTPPIEGDIALLRKYARSQEPAALIELSRRYAGVVYGTCLRITVNVHDAEELTQDCFFELARRATTIHSSFGGWLHSLATRRALNAVRSRKRRREHEQGAAVLKPSPNLEEDTAWHQLEPLLDHAIDDLPEKLRTPIILHFLENLPQSEVALRLDVHQSTVSRRIQEAIVALRTRLHKSGFVMAVAPLTSLLATHANQTAEPHLLASLTKIALAGVGATSTGKAMGGAGVVLAKLSTWGKALGALATPIFVQFFLGGWWGFLMALSFLLYFSWRQPKWHDELSIAIGGKGYGYEFFPLARWTWTTPPPGWRKAIFQALAGSVMLWFVAVAISRLRQNQMGLGWTAMIMVYAILPLVTAVRIWLRVRACPADARKTPTPIASSPDAISVVQSVCMAAVVTLFVASFALWYVRIGQPRNWLFMLLIFVVTACWAYADALGKIWGFRRGRRTQGHADSDIAPTQISNRPRAALGPLIFILVYGLGSAALGLQQCVGYFWRGPSWNVRVNQWVFFPPMALLFLVATIRLLSRLRGRIPKLAWGGLTAIAVVCAATNLTLVSTWLLFGPASLPAKPACRVANIVGNIGNVLRNKAAEIPQLKKDIHSEDPDVRRRAAILLGRMDLADEEIVPELRRALSDEAKEVRLQAALSLAQLGVKAAVPELCKALGDQDRGVKISAAVALQNMGPAVTKEAIPEYRKALSDEDPGIRETAATMLSHYGVAAKDAVPELRIALGDLDPKVRSSAAMALSMMGPAAKDAIPELRKAMSDPHWLTRHNAAMALRDIGPAAIPPSQ